MSLTSPINRMAASGETPEQTLERLRRLRCRALREHKLAVIDMTLVADDLVERVIINEFNRQNGAGI